METHPLEISITEIHAARPHVYRHLRPTPLHCYTGLSRLVGADIYVKHENHHAVGSFKVRGGVNLAAHLTDAERRAGLFTASTGNHGQSIAFAGQVTGTAVKVCLPERANSAKMAAIRNLGAEVIERGRDFDEAREWIRAEADAHGARFVGPTEPELIAGVGTYALEIVEDLPDVDVIIVPVGAGSGAAGTCLVAKSDGRPAQVIGVQAEKAPAVQRSWLAGHPVAAPMESTSEGRGDAGRARKYARHPAPPATGTGRFCPGQRRSARGGRATIAGAHAQCGGDGGCRCVGSSAAAARAVDGEESGAGA